MKLFVALLAFVIAFGLIGTVIAGPPPKAPEVNVPTQKTPNVATPTQKTPTTVTKAPTQKPPTVTKTPQTPMQKVPVTTTKAPVQKTPMGAHDVPRMRVELERVGLIRRIIERRCATGTRSARSARRRGCG